MKITNYDPAAPQGLAAGTGALGTPSRGDVTGPLPGDLTVVAIQGTPVGATPGSVGDVLTLVAGTPVTAEWEAPAAPDAPTTADYLVGTAQSGLSAEIVVGTTPGGELGGTWASPTVDATHSGSAHLALGSTSSTAAAGDHSHATDPGRRILLADGHATPFTFDDLLQMDDGSDFMWSD
jgi:hypothetical protein